ncbi:hypothetical protein AKO1_002892 [Acrasis kona]|uniref:Uncharacterized protein n=1 Tax=Acrasis kona TaxID=1008807 RepID=A0AAW2ZHA8_9EUKA
MPGKIKLIMRKFDNFLGDPIRFININLKTPKLKSIQCIPRDVTANGPDAHKQQAPRNHQCTLKSYNKCILQ